MCDTDCLLGEYCRKYGPYGCRDCQYPRACPGGINQCSSQLHTENVCNGIYFRLKELFVSLIVAGAFCAACFFLYWASRNTKNARYIFISSLVLFLPPFIMVHGCGHKKNDPRSIGSDRIGSDRSDPSADFADHG